MSERTTVTASCDTTLSLSSYSVTTPSSPVGLPTLVIISAIGSPYSLCNREDRSVPSDSKSYNARRERGSIVRLFKVIVLVNLSDSLRLKTLLPLLLNVKVTTTLYAFASPALTTSLPSASTNLAVNGTFTVEPSDAVQGILYFPGWLASDLPL